MREIYADTRDSPLETAEQTESERTMKWVQ